jgi:hypothetical protein
MKQLNKQFDFFIKEFGQHIMLTGNARLAIISDASSNPDFLDDKFIRTAETFDTGNVLEYQNEKWIVVSQIVKDKNTYRAKIRRADWQIKYYIGNTLCQTYCIVDNMQINLEEGKIITTSADEMKLIVQSTNCSSQLAIDQRFLKFGAAWKITGFDKSRRGLIIIDAKKDLFGDNDDKDNEIADRWAHETKHVYTISITDVSPITLEINTSRKLNYAVYDNGTLMTTVPEVIFEMENRQIATIDSAGNMTAISVGNTTVTCKLKNTPSISASCSLQVVKEIVKEYTITLTYTSTELYIGGLARTFTAKVLYGGVQVSDKTVLWNVTNTSGGSATTMVTLTDKGNNSCTLSAKDEYDYIGENVILTAYLSDDSNVKNTVTLTLTVY